MMVEEEKMTDRTTEDCAEADQSEQEQEGMRLQARAATVKRPVLTQILTPTCRMTCLVCQTTGLKTTTMMEMMKAASGALETPALEMTPGALEMTGGPWR